MPFSFVSIHAHVVCACVDMFVGSLAHVDMCRGQRLTIGFSNPFSRWSIVKTTNVTNHCTVSAGVNLDSCPS